MKQILFRFISLAIISATILSILIGCAAPQDEQNSDFSSSNSESDTPPEKSEEASDGIILWADGSYQADVIRHEMANDFDKTFYNDVRAMIKKKTGANPSVATDFVASGQELNDGPAILIGDTDYAESKEVYKTLKNDQGKAVISGNKYVIAYTTEAAGIELFEKLQALFNKEAEKDSIIITSKWNINVSVENRTFDESGLGASANLPTPEGLKWNTSGRDAGDGSKIYIANNADSSHYEKYLKALEKAGFTFYTQNAIHTNKFATYITKSQIVSVMFFAAKKVIKVVIDPRSTFGLPGLQSENIYTKKSEPTNFTQLGLKQIKNSAYNGMGYIVQLTDGRFVVVDAGFAYNSGDGGHSATFILNTLKKLQGNSSKKPVIAAWIVTHIHTDHAGGIMGMGNLHPNAVTIEKLIYNQPSDAQMNNVSNMKDRKNWIPTAINNFKKAGNPIKSIVKAHPGQQFFFCDLTITVLGSIDLLEPSLMGGGNDSSVVTMFEMNGSKVLLSGDAEPAECKIMRDIYGGISNKNSPLKADFIQVSHHGYGNTNTDVLSGNDQNALNVMASGGATAAGSSPIYALVPVSMDSYNSDVKHMEAMRIFPESKRIIAHDTNVTISFAANGKYTIGEGWKT